MSEMSTPIHPGETILAALKERRMTQRYLAWATGYSTKHINQICVGAVRLRPNVALAIEAELGLDARELLHQQADHDLFWTKLWDTQRQINAAR